VSADSQTDDGVLLSRIRGSLLGLAVGDALGAPLEFLSAAAIRQRYGTLREIVGGGHFGWRPGQGTDDSDLTAAVLDGYLEGYSLDGVAQRFVAWLDGRPRDVGGTTHAALNHLREHNDPTGSGRAVEGPSSAGNGSLMRCLPTGLIRVNEEVRRREAAEISAITHSDPRCIDACVAYTDLVALLLEAAKPDEALETVLQRTPLHEDVRTALVEAKAAKLRELNPSTFVIDTLRVAVCALLQPASFEEILVEVVNLGGDADSTGAVAGGLLGARDGDVAIPERWLEPLEYRSAFDAAVPGILAARTRT